MIPFTGMDAIVETIPLSGKDAIVETIPLSGNAGINHQSIPAF